MKRLDNILANSGVCSRSEARKAICSGRVTVDGLLVRSPSAKIDDNASICLDGRCLNTDEFIYLMLNKPAGYVCSNEGDDSVLRLVPKELYKKGLFTVGRLDKDTEGLLLITNDGDFAHSVTAPSRNIKKIYYAELEHEVSNDDIVAFASGLTSQNGDRFLPAKLEAGEGKSAYITVSEGKYHEVKRLFLITGNKVLYLKRLQIGGLRLDPTLGPGSMRKLTGAEKVSIFV